MKLKSWMVFAPFFVLAFVAMGLVGYIVDTTFEREWFLVGIVLMFVAFGWVIELGNKAVQKVEESAPPPPPQPPPPKLTEEEKKAKWEKHVQDDRRADKIGCLIWLGLGLVSAIIGYLLNK